MIDSLILRTVARLLMPVLSLVALFMFLRGHHQPGGGFIAGLIASIGFALHGLAWGPAALRQVLRADPLALVATGLTLALLAALAAALAGAPFFTGLWWEWGAWSIGTPVLFDLGVSLTMVGAMVAIVLALAESGPGAEAEVKD